MMAVLAMRWLDESGYAASGGSSTAYTFTPQQTLTAYRDGLTITFRAHAACGATPTLNVSSLGAKALRNRANGTLAANEIASGAWVTAVYSSSLDTFVITNQGVFSEMQALLQGGGFFGMPVGAIVDTAGTSAPTGWLLCYGQAISRTTYSSLFAVLSTTYGTGDGSTTFNVPELRGSVTAGLDNMGGADAGRLANALTISGGRTTLGGRMGAGTHTLLEAEIPQITPAGSISTATTSHTAQQGGLNAGGILFATNTAGFAFSTSAGAQTFTGTTFGGGGVHNNTQPTFMTNKIIFTGVP